MGQSFQKFRANDASSKEIVSSCTQCPKHILQLPWVCKAFHSVFEAHPELGCQVVLIKKVPKSTSLVPWLQARAAATQHLDSGSSAADRVKYLEVLLHSCSSLKSIRIKVKSRLHFLTHLASLTSCSLKFVDFDETPDLSPLSGLQKLSHLSLDNGYIQFGCLPTLVSLTHLELCGVKVETSYCTFVSTLGKLRVEKCDLEGLHTRGLLGFTALQSLQLCDSCVITADDYADSCKFGIESFPPGMPNDMSPLFSLTCIQLLYPMDQCYPGVGMQLDFRGIDTLPNLQSLEIMTPGTIIFDHEYEKLTRLTSLHISARKCSKDHLSFTLDWQVLQALQQLEVNGSFAADRRLLGLAMLPYLRRVNLKEVIPANQITCSVFNDLEDAMALRHQDILFHLSMSKTLDSDVDDQGIDENIQDLRLVFDR